MVWKDVVCGMVGIVAMFVVVGKLKLLELN